MPRHTPKLFRVTDGGRLITAAAPESIGPANYCVKTNWRRVDDREIRREGTEAFGLGCPETLIGMWEAIRPNGERALIGASATSIYRCVNGTWDLLENGFAADWWQGESHNGYLILNNGADLPVTFRVEDDAVYPMYELREVGIAAVHSIAVFNGFLLCSDVVEIPSDNLSGIMNGSDPYGRIDPDTCNRIRYRIIWSDYNNPTNWAPVITGTIQEASKNVVTLVWPTEAFNVGDKLAVVGAGPGGGTRGGQSDCIDGVEILGIDSNGTGLTLAVDADADLTYPLTVQVTRFADTSSFVGYSDIQDDSSAILRMLPLKQALIVYRETSIFVGRYTASVAMPFMFSLAYRGPDVPRYPLAIESVEGEYHVFPSADRFYFFDNAGNPRVHKVLDDARTLFFNAPGEHPFARVNPLTKEVWFVSTEGVLALDYVQNTASWIDEAYTALTVIQDPASSADVAEQLFLMALAGDCYKQSAISWLRASGNPAVPVLRAGFYTWDDLQNQKDLRNYGFEAGPETPDCEFTVILRGKDAARATPRTLFTSVVTTPTTSPRVAASFRNVMFQDELQVTDDGDVNASIVSRDFEFAIRPTRSATRNA